MLLCAVNKGIAEPGLLAKELELSPSRLTRILDSLESRDLTKRELSSLDRRSMLVTLTEQGKQMVEHYSCTGLILPADLEFTQN
ncbi:MarR family transcriptional regulator [Sphaerochaeta sp. PS]|nr:MarR family transcriptional regulator [Sphaerochaeta sp. PS]MDT4762707.1 MarR family transcriptional regulator [Sphaerochaeta sp. PS]